MVDDSQGDTLEADRLSRVEIAALETDMLTRAIGDMDGWISGLPDASALAWTFRRAQAELVADLDALHARSLPRTRYQAGAVLPLRA